MFTSFGLVKYILKDIFIYTHNKINYIIIILSINVQINEHTNLISKCLIDTTKIIYFAYIRDQFNQ